MRRLILSATLLFLCVSTSALAQWTWLNPKPQGHTLNDVEFLDDDTAIAVGEAGTVMVTHDAGLTWNWKSKVNGLTATLRAVTRIDDQTAVAVGSGGLILKTIDAGATWVQVPSGTTSPFSDVDSEAGLAIAVGDGPLLRSTNGGDSWSPSVVGFPPLRDVDVVTATVVVAVADFIVFRSEDGGLTWQAPFIGGGLATISFSDELNGVFSQSGNFQFTNDGGQTWEERFGPDLGTHHDISPTEIELDGIETLFVSATAGGCDGMMNCFSAGHLLRSTDGGDAWDVESSARPMRGISRNGNGVVILVGDAGSIYRWTDPNWQQVGGSPYNELDLSAGAAFLDPSVGIVAATQLPVSVGNVETTFLRTSDGGATWTPKSLFGTYIADIAYVPGPTPSVYAVGRQQLNGIAEYYPTQVCERWRYMANPVVEYFRAKPECGRIPIGVARRGRGRRR